MVEVGNAPTRRGDVSDMQSLVTRTDFVSLPITSLEKAEAFLWAMPRSQDEVDRLFGAR